MERSPKLPPSLSDPATSRGFHAERWEKSAKPGLFGVGKKSANDLMQEEARRGDTDFENRRHKEFLAWQKNLAVVITGFKEKAQHPENSSIKTLVVIMGGGMKSAYAAGQVIGLNSAGLTADKVDTVVGASGGAVVATAYAGGPEQTIRTTEMMAGPMSSKDFIDPKRFVSGEMINLPHLKTVMEDPSLGYAIDQEAIRTSGTELWYTMTLPVRNNEEPEVRFVNAKEVPSMTEAITASMSLPYLTGPIPKINGVEYFDGAISPLPIKQLIEQFNPTHVLILPQTPFIPRNEIKPSMKESVQAAVAQVASQKSLAIGLRSRYKFRKSLEQIENIDGVHIGFMWPPDEGLETLDIDSDKFVAAVMSSTEDTLRQLGTTDRVNS